MDNLIVLICILGFQTANGQGGERVRGAQINRAGPDVMGQGGPGPAAGVADPAATAFGVAAELLNPMGPGRPFVPGMTAGQVADLMGGRPGPVPMDIAIEAQHMRMLGYTPDQIADILGDKLQLRFINPLGALASAALSQQLAGTPGDMTGNAPASADALLGSMGVGPGTQTRSDMLNALVGGGVGGPVTNISRSAANGPGWDLPVGGIGPADLLNPMGPGRPFVPGMTAGQVADLMGGRPGPVPMDIAIEAQQMRMLGHTPDQIADILGDKLQLRFSNSLRAMAGAALSQAIAGAVGGTNAGPGNVG